MTEMETFVLKTVYDICIAFSAMREITAKRMQCVLMLLMCLLEQDIIEDENIKLDWLFRISLISDLINVSVCRIPVIIA